MNLNEEQKQVIDQALSILSGCLKRGSLTATGPDSVKQFCQLHLAHLEHEVFGVLFLDNRHRLISFVEMFRGTIDGASVYPREVAKAALYTNAAAVIFTHNHPSGVTEPSAADKSITSQLVNALRLLDIRVLDHIVVSHDATYSFSENGLL
ncbi:MAG: DNA repair protein RadC [Candidatus Thiodiazotropha sp. (ex Monitilora ramsayi)]|nr:DNA repair protein RadC [Candidatus Thiodiazotropha sp. (ex Monitilora ramsayi)]